MTQDTDARQKDCKAKGRCARCRQGLPQTIDPVTGARICRLCARGFQREDFAGDGQHDAVGAMRRFLERCVEADAPMLAATATATAIVATTATAPATAGAFGGVPIERGVGRCRSWGRGQDSEQEQT